jgi:beta-xylosidase
MLRSQNLTSWQPIGAVLEPPDPSLGSDFWAPEICIAEGRFYLYYSVGFGDKHHKLRVAVAARPEGPYRDCGVNLVDPERCPFAIDASPFLDEDGSRYLFYARDFLDQTGGARVGTGIVVDRLLDMTHLEGNETTVIRPSQDWQRFMRDRPMYGGFYDWHTLEGPCIRKHGDTYYCFFSGGRWEDETYGIDFAQAPHPLGSWTSIPSDASRVLRSVPGTVIGPGHNSLITVPDRQTDYLVYHAWDPQMTARRMCIDKLEWFPFGPQCQGPTSTPQPL